jgi:hypothetical protein
MPPRRHPPKRQGPCIPLVSLDGDATLTTRIDHLVEESAKERVLALVPFVAGLRSTFARQWPAEGVEQGRPGHFIRTWPFPDCWPLHPELMLEFAWLRSWTTAVETGDVELQEAHGGAWDRWLRHVREATVPMVREIAQLCMLSGTNQHVDPAVPRPGFGRARSTPSYGTARPTMRWGRRAPGATRSALGGLS